MAKTTLITGANRGIGLQMARQAAARGDRVLASVRDPASAPELAAVPGVTVLGFDVTDPEALARAAGETGPIDLLICNAGQLRARGGVDDPEHTAEIWGGVLMTNVTGVFFTVRAFLPALAQAAEPKIAVISSIMASSARAPGGCYLYRASKAAATNLACNLAVDLKDQGIAVGAYHPGWVRTDMGGPSAQISVEESAEGLLARFDALTLETTGVFEDYRGEVMAF